MAIIHVQKVTVELIQYIVDGHAVKSTPQEFEAKYPAWMHGYGRPRAGVRFETSPHRQVLVTRRLLEAFRSGPFPGVMPVALGVA